MSYQVLARKWRPGNFSQVAGQGHVLKSLVTALDNERLHHAYLFTGTRGVGKTTLARILAKCLNCEKGISSTPCGECDSCAEISQGRFIDLIEVDAASRTKVEDTRELLENVQYTPTRGRFKVYLIDEVHMLSAHSFNALLKTLEEPPPHVKFLFATTDPQKLPVTILSRCLQFNLKNLSPETIVQYLMTVLESEKIQADEEALWQISAAATGSMRDALTLVDQAIAYCQGEIKTEGVVEMLGIPTQRQVYDLLAAMAAGNAPELVSVIDSMAEQAPDYGHTLDSLLSILHRIALAQVVPDAIDNSFGDREQIHALAKQFIAEDVQMYYQIGSKGRDELRLAGDLRAAFEMLLLRMLVFSPEFRELEHEPGEESAADPAMMPPQAEKKKIKAPRLRDKDADTGASQAAAQKQAPEVEAGLPATEVNAVAGESPDWRTTSDNDGATADLSDLDQRQWLHVFPQLDISGIVANVLGNTQIDRVMDNQLSLILDESQSAVFSDDLLPRMSRAVSDFYGREIEVTVNIARVTVETPARLGQRIRQDQQQQLIDEFEQDDNVQALLKRFSATLARDSIAPIDESG